MTPYVYRVIDVLRIVDGDSYNVLIDLGFHARIEIKTRLLGCDTFELRGGTEGEKERARAGRLAASEWFRERDGLVFCETKKADSFGRHLATFRTAASEDLTDHLIGLGLTTGRFE